MTEPDLDLKPRLERLGDRVQPRADAFDRLDRARAKRTRVRRAGTIVLALIVAVAGSWGALAVLRAQGDGNPAGHPTATASPTHVAAIGLVPPCDAPASASLSITAKDITWDVTCLSAPADTPLSIRYHNRDAGIPNGLTIVSIDSCEALSLLSGGADDCPQTTHPLFQGDLVTGPDAITYEVGSLPRGVYVVYDPVHPVTSHATMTVA